MEGFVGRVAGVSGGAVAPTTRVWPAGIFNLGTLGIIHRENEEKGENESRDSTYHKRCTPSLKNSSIIMVSQEKVVKNYRTTIPKMSAAVT